MTPRFNTPALLLTAALALGGCAGTRDLDLGYQTGYSDDGYVYDDLASYGAWVDVASYGWVWCPEVAASWQPYTVGYWVNTDDGWFWVADDPWGSVPYHYGRWAFADDYGWIWVPGDVWAPAWCAWRYGDGWVGWAPLPPDVPWLVPVGIELSADDLDQRIRRHVWSFTKADEFGTRRERVRVESADRDETLFAWTRNVTKYAAGSRPVEEGLRPDLIRELRGTKLERFRIVDSEKPVSKNGLRIRGREAEVYRPKADVKAIARDRMRAVPSRNPSTQALPRERAEREPEKPVQVAQREEVTHEEAREASNPRAVDRAENVARERQPVARERPEPVRDPVTRDEKVRDRVERIAQQREETARQREEVAERQEEARRLEQVARERERQEAARQREDARRSEREEAAQQREEAPQTREKRSARQREVEARNESEQSANTKRGERNKETVRSEDAERDASSKRVREPRAN